MASLADIRAGLKANLVASGFTNVNLYTTSNPTPPCFEIDLDGEGVGYDQSFNRGFHELTLIVRAVLTESEGSQVTLDTYVDGAASTDVKAALETDATLGGAASASHVTQVVPRRWKSDTTGGLLIGAEWTVYVLATGTS